MNTVVEMVQEANRLSGLLEDSLRFLNEQVKKAAQAEHDYRKAVAEEWVAVKQTLPDGTVAEREAYVKGITAEVRKRRDLADGLRQAGLEAIRSRRAQISLLQSVLSAHKSEAEFSRTGPEVAA